MVKGLRTGAMDKLLFAQIQLVILVFGSNGEEGWFPGLTPETDDQDLCQNAERYRAGNDVTLGSGRTPFEIVIEPKTYLPGKPMKVWIKPRAEYSDRHIQGAIIQARDYGRTGTVGSMYRHNGAEQVNCYSQSDTLYLWKQVPDYAEVKVFWDLNEVDREVNFVATIFENTTLMWENVTSQPFEMGFEPIDLSTCGITKGCFRYSTALTECDAQTCDYLFTYRTLPGDEVQFEMSSKSEWVAIGFSSDQKMGGDDVLMCETSTGRGNVAINHYHNNAHTSPKKVDTNPTTLHQTQWVDGRISCRFNRPLYIPRDSENVDLNNDWYHLYAWGDKSPYGSGALHRHTIASPPTSDVKIALVTSLVNVKSGALRHSANTTFTAVYLLTWVAFLGVIF